MGYQSVLGGVVGEQLACARFQTLGWQMPDGDFLGRNTQDLDLVATSPDGSVAVEIQVNTITTDDGKIGRQKPGRACRSLDGSSSGQGPLAAFVLMRADEESVWVEPDPHRSGSGVYLQV